MNKQSLNHPIVEASFAIIDHEVGAHSYSREQYHVVRRAIHATADFEFLNLFYFSPQVIATAIHALKDKTPVIVDVGMVQKGIQGMVNQTSHNPIICALEAAKTIPAGKTRTETGLLNCLENYPQGIYVIGNAPTALLALCDAIAQGKAQPSLVIGAPVGFVSVVESKQALARTQVPQIRVEGRKGGSAVAGAIVNALLVLSAEEG
ncbi:MAG: cobalt-precorrin-8X methylmutase [Cyanobacteria bacterium]|jgi:precorrin-8X/cobalt-precorrin-8 methylmutase|nr:cobalt-precorrin-8X methylmutase [Cyanobacteria bacterium GSL.Bin21]